MADQESTLKLYKSVRTGGMIASVVVGLAVTVIVFQSLGGVREAIHGEDNRMGRRRGRSVLVVYGAPLGAGLFVGLAAWGLVLTGLPMIERRLKWSVYQITDDGKRLRMGHQLDYDDMKVLIAQLENREPSSTFERVPDD